MRTYFLLPIIAFLLVSCGVEEPAPSATDENPSPTTNLGGLAPAAAPVYVTQTVTLEDVSSTSPITGRVIPLQQATVSSRVPGLVLPTDKLLQPGKYYESGEVMVRIDHETLDVNLQAERAQLISSLVPLLSNLELDFPEAFPEWKRFTNAIQPDKLLPDLPAMTSERVRYFIYGRGIPAAHYRIRAQETTLDDYTVRAPFSGQLVSASVEPGTYVQPGAPLATLSRTDVFEFRAAIPEREADRISVGQTMELTAQGGTKYTATVNRFDPVIDQATQTVTAYLRLSGKGLRSGTYLEGNLSGEVLKNVAVLPREALHRDDTMLYKDGNTVRSVAVDVIRLNADNVYVRGLTNGQEILTQATAAAALGATSL